ncbi:MAG: hypothetical protein WED10_03305 [Brumimicrobium sp.]
MKTITLLFTLIFFGSFGIGQDCSPVQMLTEGTVWETTNYNKKDKIQGTNSYEVLSMNKADDKVIWELKMIMKDKKGELITESVTEVSCEDGIFKMDMKQFSSPETMDAMKDMDVTIDATEVQYPTSLEAGQTLPDAEMTVEASSSGMKVMTIKTQITDRKVEDLESIETPAGSYKCFVMSQNTNVKNSIVDVTTKSKEWFFPGFGVVRSESYDKKGNLSGYTVLTSIKKP